VGTRLAAMTGGGIVANEAAIKDYFNAPDAAAIREKAGKLGEMSQAYAQLTAGQLFDDVKVPPRVQTVANKALASVAQQTAESFGPDGFTVKDDARLSALALGQHAGYVAGELSRHHGVDEPTARKALIEYFNGGGDVDKLISDAGLPPKTDSDFWNSNGWMFAGGFNDNKEWGFWGFGATDQALNRPGVYAGEASLKVAEALDKGNGEQLLASTLSKDPAQWNDNEKIVGNFALRAAQLGWLTSKLGQGVVEAHNPKKEAKAAGRWAPGNDLITDFNSMAEAKGWNEVAKDLDQIKSFATSSGILTPQGNPASSSYYVMKDGQKLDRELLGAFERGEAGPRDGRVSQGDVRTLARPEILDGGAVTDTELATLAWAKDNFNFTGAGARELQALEVDAKLTRADEFGPHSHMYLEGNGSTPDYAKLSTEIKAGEVSLTLRDNDSMFGGGQHHSPLTLRINGEDVSRSHRNSSTIPYGQWEGEKESIWTSQAKLPPGTHLVEIANGNTGDVQMMKVTVPDLKKLDNAQFDALFTGQLGGEKLAQLTDHLVGGAQDALATQSFGQRNQMMADVVGDEGGLLAARSAGLPSDQAGQVQSVFRDAARMAGREFRHAFDGDGNKLADKEGEYKQAMSEAGKWAFHGMDDLARAMGRNVGFMSDDSERIVQGARIEDVAAIVANDLGLPDSVTQMSGAELKSMIDQVVPQDDYFRKDIDGIPLRTDQDDALSGGDQKVLSMGIRLANATWKAGQVHRAAWEGNDGRINPDKRTAFNTFDALKVNMFDQTTNGDKGVKAQQEGFARVVFEVYKDLIQLQKAAGE
jgi:hypothetical protein